MIELLCIIVTAAAVGCNGYLYSKNRRLVAYNAALVDALARAQEALRAGPPEDPELDAKVAAHVEAFMATDIPGRDKKAYVIKRHLKLNPGTPVSHVEASIERILKAKKENGAG